MEQVSNDTDRLKDLVRQEVKAILPKLKRDPYDQVRKETQKLDYGWIPPLDKKVLDKGKTLAFVCFKELRPFCNADLALLAWRTPRYARFLLADRN